MRNLRAITLPVFALAVAVGVVGCDRIWQSPESEIGAAVIHMFQPLYGGQNIEVGNVEVWNDDYNLFVKFNITADDWFLSATAVHVALFPQNIPQTKTGNPIPGKFAYKVTHSPYVTSYTYTIPLPATFGQQVAIATHANLVRVVNGTVVQTETGWAGPNQFPGANWATWFWYTIQRDGDEEHYREETAWGYDITNPAWFFKPDYSTKWGGVIPHTLGSTTLVDLWAGAGNNVPANGTVVGTVTVTDDVVNGVGNVYVRFDLVSGCKVSTTHVGADATIALLAANSNGFAPGQFASVETHTPWVTTCTHTLIYDADWGSSFVVGAHADVHILQ